MIKGFLLASIFWIYSLTAVAGDFRWSVTVLNQKTKEKREFFPENEALKIPTEGPFSCLLSKVEDLSDNTYVAENRNLTCSSNGVALATTVSCLHRKDSPGSKESDTSPLLGFDKSGEHIFTIRLICATI